MPDKATPSLAPPALKPSGIGPSPKPAPNRRSAQEYGATPQVRPSALQRLLSVLKTLAWVAPLTILIWIYAEREESFTDRNVPCPVELQTTSPDRTVVILGQDTGTRREANLLVNLDGPRANVFAVEREIQSTASGHPVLQIALGPEYDPGEHTLDTEQLIDANPVFAKYGVTVQNCQPAAIKVRVDKMETMSLPVHVGAAPENMQGTPVFDPTNVSVRAPASYFKRAAQNLFVTVDLTPFTELKQDGQHTLPSVAVTWPFKDDSVSFGTASVKAIVHTSTPSLETTVQSLLVCVVLPPKQAKDDKVEYDPTLKDVRIKGPRDAIAPIIAAGNKLEPPAKALLEIQYGDPEDGTEITRGVRFEDMPPGVQVVDPDAYKVTFKLVKRD